MSRKQKTEEELLLEEINNKLELAIFFLALQVKKDKEKYKILKDFSKTSKLSKREIERITGIDRHKF